MLPKSIISVLIRQLVSALKIKKHRTAKNQELQASECISAILYG